MSLVSLITTHSQNFDLNLWVAKNLFKNKGTQIYIGHVRYQHYTIIQSLHLNANLDARTLSQFQNGKKFPRIQLLYVSYNNMNFSPKSMLTEEPRIFTQIFF